MYKNKTLNFNRKNIIIVLLFSLILISIFVLIFVAKAWGDEINYHYPNARYFSISRILDSNSSYSSAYTPLPYLFGKILLSFYDNIKILRLLNFIIFITIIYFTYLISKRISKFPFLLSFLIILNPYLLRSAFTYYMFNYGLLFVLIGIYLYYFKEDNASYIFSHIFLGLAVLSQQWMLIVFVCIFLAELWVKRINVTTKNFFFKSIVIKILVVSPAILLFYLWHGFTHPNFHAHNLEPTFEHLTASLANWGFISIFIIPFYFRQYILKKDLIPLIIVLPLLFLSIPQHTSSHGAYQITGVAAQVATQIQHIVMIPYGLTFFIFALVGLLLIVIMILKRKEKFEKFIFLCLIGFLVTFTSSTLLGASHIFLSIPFLLLLFRNEIIENKYISYLLLAQLYIISLFYIFYWGLFVVNGLPLD